MLFDCVARETSIVTTSQIFKSLTGPLKLSSTEEASYWAHKDSSHSPITFKFIGLLDLHGSSARSKPYFSLEGSNSVSIYPPIFRKSNLTLCLKIDVASFKRTKAIFEIRVLPMEAEEYPLNARRASNIFLRGVVGVTNEFETKRNNSEVC